ncbi:Uncharacterised protein [Klebsiella variicola]|uniref:Uncharacterized protein n=1 Tax=Klebsiella variicola TaxID=244366 RepID=A0A7H4N416_KLEVA|nr:Uncharacterised protein [Klebsiella variicola]
MWIKTGVKGAVLPTANFEPLPWVLSFEQLSLALAHSSLANAQQIVKLNNPSFTGLTRFLGTDNTVHAFGAMEKAGDVAGDAQQRAGHAGVDGLYAGGWRY